MPIMLDDFHLFIRKVETLQRNFDKLEGAEEGILRALKENHEVSTFEEAEKKLAKLIKRRQAALEEVNKERDALERKWGDEIAELEEK